MRRTILAALLVAAALSAPSWAGSPKKGSPMILGVTLNPSTFVQGGTDGTVVGPLAVQMKGAGVFSGTLAIGGADAAKFKLSSTSLPSNLELNGTQSGCGSGCAITIIPTQSKTTNSGHAYPLTVTGTGSTTILTPTLSNSTFAAGSPDSTVIGVLGASLSTGGSFTGTGGTFSLASGACCQVVGTSLETSGSASCPTGCAVSVNAIYAGASNTPLAQAFTVTSIAGAARTADFLATLGVNGHVDQNVTPYISSPSAVAADAVYLGIKLWRDGLAAQASWQLATLQALVNAGVSLDAVPQENTTLVVSDQITKAKAWAALGAGALHSLEGPNEPSNFPIVYNGVSTGPPGAPTTFAPVAGFQQAYYTAIKADSVLHATPVYSTSLGGAEPNNYGQQYLTVPAGPPAGVLSPAGAVYADSANLHSYPMYDGGAQTIDATADRIKVGYYNNFVHTYAKNYAGYTTGAADALPKVVSEFGYAAKGGCAGCVTVTRAVQAKNLLTGFFNFWTEGYRFIDVYDLYDLGDGFGIFTSPGVPTISATYMHNATTVLYDGGTTARTFTPGSLAYTFSALPSTGASALYQKSSGPFELVVWNNVANWNFAAGTATSVSPTSVTIDFGTSKLINVYDPTSGTSPIQTVTASSVVISLADYPLIVQVQ